MEGDIQRLRRRHLGILSSWISPLVENHLLLTYDRDKLTGALRIANDTSKRRKAKLEEAEREIERLRKYAQHLPTCLQGETRDVIHSSQGDMPVYYKCDCGLDATLSRKAE